MTESMLLSLAGGASGLAVAYFVVAALRWLNPPSRPLVAPSCEASAMVAGPDLRHLTAAFEIFS